MAAGKGAGKPPHRGTTCGYAHRVFPRSLRVLLLLRDFTGDHDTRGDYGQGDKKEKFKFARTSNSALQYVNYPTQVWENPANLFQVNVTNITVCHLLHGLILVHVLSDDPGSHDTEEEVSSGEIPVCAADRKRRRSVPLQTQKSSAVADDHIFGFGEILLLVSLTLDGLTGVAQDHMRARFQTGANHMMLNINMWSTWCWD
ncbi:hypothetical protein INR49_032387 [Caranx melampygus]|nr:hypothetical protein INR49_032387 [Caranx melampygus]